MVEMIATAPNPFSVTKANDFTDEEIRDFWVDYADEGGFLSLFAPHEAMPKFLLGGKGSGKTHLMRYYSFPLQALRARERASILDQIADDGYIGIYTRCGGLDTSRFAGKGQETDTWDAVFAYYMDLWLSYHVVDAVDSLLSGLPNRPQIEAALCSSIVRLFDDASLTPPDTLKDLKSLLRTLQHIVNLAVNNAAITRTLDLKIAASPGRLVFGVPKEVVNHVPALSRVSFIYQIDELELLSEDQQRLVNTLIRDRTPPVTFRIGARTYGVRTFATLAAEEENRPGSEFDRVPLDEHLRAKGGSYETFARKLILKRLRRAGFMFSSENDLDSLFESTPQSKYREQETAFVRAKNGERRYFEKLREQLSSMLPHNPISGVTDSQEIDSTIDSLRVENLPLLEKLNVFLFYRALAGRKDLRASTREIAEACRALVSGTIDSDTKWYETELKHFSANMYAQLCKEYDQQLRYRGLSEFIALSDGLPRSLLIILKYTYKWAVFAGERPFRGSPVSTRAQDRGVLEASDWFFNEMPRGGGEEALEAKKGVARVAELLRELAYSHKPPECRLISFATDLNAASESARSRVRSAHEISLLVRVPRGGKDKNSGRVDEKFYLNRMLVPRWGLPPARGGTITLRPEETDAAFSPARDEEFQDAKSKRVSRATFPFGLTPPQQRPSMPLFDGHEDD